MKPGLLKRPSFSSVGLYHQLICKDLPSAHIRSHYGHEWLHPPAHQPRPRTLRSELDRQRRTWARPRASFPSLRREWAVHY
jgi:hypothetical protein